MASSNVESNWSVPASGEPSGLLLEMNELVDRAVPPLSREELAEGMRLASQDFLATGSNWLRDTRQPFDALLVRRVVLSQEQRDSLMKYGTELAGKIGPRYGRV